MEHSKENNLNMENSKENNLNMENSNEKNLNTENSNEKNLNTENSNEKNSIIELKNKKLIMGLIIGALACTILLAIYFFPSQRTQNSQITNNNTQTKADDNVPLAKDLQNQTKPELVYQPCRITPKINENYICGMIEFEKNVEKIKQKLKMFYALKETDANKKIMTDISKIIQEKNDFRDIEAEINSKYSKYTIYADNSNNDVNMLINHSRSHKIDEGMIKKMVENIPRQGWKDFILSLSPEEVSFLFFKKKIEGNNGNDKILLFITYGQNFKEPELISENVRSLCLQEQWKVIKRIDYVVKGFIKMRKIADSIILHEANNINARLVQFDYETIREETTVELNFKTMRLVQIDGKIVIYDKDFDIVKLFDNLKQNEYDAASKMISNMAGVSPKMNIIIIDPTEMAIDN